MEHKILHYTRRKFRYYNGNRRYGNKLFPENRLIREERAAVSNGRIRDG